MSPELRNHNHPVRTKEEAFQDLVEKCNRAWHDRMSEPLIDAEMTLNRGVYDTLQTVEACDVELDRLRAKASNNAAMVRRGFTIPIDGHEVWCECIALVRLVEKRKAALIEQQNVSAFGRIFGGHAA